MTRMSRNAGQLDLGDPQFHDTIARAQRVFAHNIPLLIQGETGTGKEMFARALHQHGPRAGRPFVALNCVAIPAQLIEAELFGYEAGAFTGARLEGAPGKLREADGGTLFLDEIGDMPNTLQAALLRVLETRSVVPLGGNTEFAVDIALISSCHAPLGELVTADLFRADLWFRLSGLTVVLPPLRERKDFDRLARSILIEEANRHGLGQIRLASAATAHLRQQSWPGNVRQLRNVLSVALALMEPGETVLDLHHLPEESCAEALPTSAWVDGAHDLRSLEDRVVRDCVARHGGNISAAARELGVTRTTVYRRLRSPD